MNITELFIRRPIMTSLVMIGILIFGISSYRLLPISDLPNVDFPTIQVSASLPGANPETMASAVATPLEKEFSTIAALDSMTSSSAQGSTQITLQFTLDRDIDAAAQDIQAAISRTLGQLPPDMPSPPSFRKVNPADSPVFYVALTSTTLPLSTVDEYAETLLAQRISTIAGVAQVQVYGSQKYAVRIRLDPNTLAARGIDIEEVRQAVSQHNVNLPTGTLYGEHRAFTVQASGQLGKAADFRPVIVAYRNGAPIRLQELGQVIDSVQTDKLAAWYHGTRGVVLAIQRQPGTNTIQVVDSIKKLLPTFLAQMPAGIEMDILYDRSLSIRDSVADVQFTLLLATALVVMVIFVFLRNLPATIIPSLALPMSVIGTFSVMYLLGYSVDNLSLMALTLSVGFVVDDAIVMLENIVTPYRDGRSAAAGEPQRREGGRLHHRVDDAVAGCRIHPGAVHGRRAGQTVAGILGHHHGGSAGLGLRVAEPDADAVQPHAAAARGGQAQPLVQRQRSSFRGAEAPVWGHPGLGAQVPLVDHAGVRCRLCRHCMAVHVAAERIPAERGHRAAVRLHRGDAGYFLRGHGAETAGGGRHHSGRSQRGGRNVVHRAADRTNR